MTEHRDADVERPGGGVATHEFDLVRVGKGQESTGEGRDKSFVDAWQRPRQRERQGLRAAGREVAQVHRQRLVAQVLRRYGGQEVAAFDQHVARHRKLHAWRHLQERAVVTHAECGAAHGAREVARNEVELTHDQSSP